MTETYCIAGQAIRITSVHEAVHQMCRAYRCEDSPVFCVETTQEDIDKEREKSMRNENAEGLPHRQYAEAYLEELAVYRQIAEQMPLYDTVLFHGSAIAADGWAYLFTAKSGTGKSTHARLWREMLGSRAVMVNDDKPMIRIPAEGSPHVYGTPWDGKHHLSNPINIPVKAICLLHQSAANQIRRISMREAFPMLYQQVYRPANPAALEKTLGLIDRLENTVKFYRLGCNMEPEAAELSYHTMKEGVL